MCSYHFSLDLSATYEQTNNFNWHSLYVHYKLRLALLFSLFYYAYNKYTSCTLLRLQKFIAVMWVLLMNFSIYKVRNDDDY